MDEQHKERLLSLADALDSEAYTQIRGQLRRLDCYCCLGVACEEYRKNTGETIEWDKDSFLGSYSELANEVRDYYGFVNALGNIKSGNHSLMYLNDTLRWSFKDIAAFIRETVQ